MPCPCACAHSPACRLPASPTLPLVPTLARLRGCCVPMRPREARQCQSLATIFPDPCSPCLVLCAPLPPIHVCGHVCFCVMLRCGPMRTRDGLFSTRRATWPFTELPRCRLLLLLSFSSLSLLPPPLYRGARMMLRSHPLPPPPDCFRSVPRGQLQPVQVLRAAGAVSGHVLLPVHRVSVLVGLAPCSPWALRLKSDPLPSAGNLAATTGESCPVYCCAQLIPIVSW